MNAPLTLDDKDQGFSQSFWVFNTDTLEDLPNSLYLDLGQLNWFY